MKKKARHQPFGQFLFIGRWAAMTCLSLFFSIGLSAQTTGRQMLQGHIPPAVARLHLQPTSGLAATQRLKLAISLPLRNLDSLTNLLQQMYDPASPDYHHFLTPQQFTEQFGPTERDYQAVIAYAKANGLTVTGTHPNRVLLDVSGTVADIEKTFQVTLLAYQHPVENRTFYAPDVEPSLDLSVPVSGIIGLDNYRLPRPLFRRAARNQSSMNQSLTGSAPGGSGAYFGSDFRKAYAPGTALDGTGQAVALFECADYFSGDITNYVALAKLNPVPLSNVRVDGGPPPPARGDGVNVEVALDIEMANCMAPGLSKILVYEGPGDTPAVDFDILNQIANDNLAKQISSSWVIGDSPQYAAIYTQFAMQGQTFLQASGDEGAYFPGIFQFEDSPLVTLVGGTTLTTGAGGAWASEKVWNWGNGVAGGGGISSVYVIPSWQRGISMTHNQGSTVYRNVPDVALTADNIFVVADNGLHYPDVGGTSCAAPLWAGFNALVNQQARINGQPNVGFINPAVYAIGKGANYNPAFHDIKSGNNTTPSSPTKFFAVAGYDLCTGWGTPNGTNLINLLVQPPDALQVLTTNAFLPTFPAGGPISATTQNYTLTNIGGTSLNWSLTCTSLWLNVTPGSGTLAGGAQTTVTAGLSGAAASLPVGTYTTTIFFNDLNTGASQTRQAVLSVLPLVLNGGFETGDFTDWTLSGNPTNAYVTGSSFFVFSGNYAARVGKVGSLGYLSQTVPTVSGYTYVLSFWLENPDGGLTNEFNVSWNGNILYDQVNLPAFGWTNLQFTVTATGSSSQVQFGFRNDQHFFGLDEVSLTATSANSPLQFQLLTTSGNQLTLGWNASTGSVYQVQYKTNLLQVNWINLSGALTAADSTLSVTDLMGPDPQRFYRIQLLP